ncbi:hypothetical protein [Gemmobacter denitrificans]|uniref:Disulfide bond formation protein DsbB n=1 Tax=Gemmobacter denitrificans TaxID=3123040 RepID=A0ABU8BUU1_9RHOB
MRKWVYGILILGLILCFSPLLAVIWAVNFAARHGCDLHEGGINPCLVDGADWGETLYTAFVSGWFMLLTLPVAGILGIVLLAFALYDLIRTLRARGRS